MIQMYQTKFKHYANSVCLNNSVLFSFLKHLGQNTRFCLDHNYAMFQCSICNHIASNKKQIKSIYARYFEHLLKPNSLRRILGRLKFNLYMYLYKQYGSLFF